MIWRFLASWQGLAFVAAAALLLFMGYAGFRWHCEDRAREWRRWRAEVDSELQTSALGRFTPPEPWYVRWVARLGAPRRIGW